MQRKPHHTKDENYVLSIAEEAELASGGIENPVDRYLAGKRAGMNPKGVDATCKLLIQANFIKKSSESDIYLTPHGVKLVERLRLE